MVAVDIATSAGLPEMMATSLQPATEPAANVLDVEAPARPQVAELPRAEVDSPSPIISVQAFRSLILIVWGCGSLVWLVNFSRNVLAFRKLVKHARPAPKVLQAEAATLAAMIRAPNRLAPNRHPDDARLLEEGVHQLVFPVGE